MAKDSPAAPAPPDYKAAAEASRSNQVTPFGSSTWTPAQAANPGTQGQWVQGPPPDVTGMRTGDRMKLANSPGGLNSTQVWQAGADATPAVAATNTTTLSPDLEKGLLGVTGRVAENMSKPPDLSSVQDISDKAYGAFTARLDPQWQQQQGMQETQLRNQGLVPGGQAYDDAMRVFNQAKNDAYQQANLGAIQTMPQTYQLANDQYNQPLNQLNALRTGAQIQGPQFEGSADYLNAANMQAQYGQGLYNAQVGQQNAMTSGLFGLGAAGVIAL